VTAAVRKAAVDLCLFLDQCNSLRAPLLDVLTDPGDALVKHLAAWCFSVHTRPGMGDHLAQHVGDVAMYAREVERDRRTDCICHHDETSRGWDCSHADVGGCDACTQHHADLLDGAVTELLYLLGDQARADLEQVAA
jgi:hypothetical protein